MLSNGTNSIFLTVITALLALSSFSLSYGKEISFNIILGLEGICDGDKIIDNKGDFETAMTGYLNEALGCLGSGGNKIKFSGGSYYIQYYKDVLIYDVTNAKTNTAASTTTKCKVDVSFTTEATLTEHLKGKKVFRTIGICGFFGCLGKPSPSKNELAGFSFFPFANRGSFRRRLKISSTQTTSNPTDITCQDQSFLSKMDEIGFGMIIGTEFKEITIL